jgi:mono/diheme cytochrome c family protein
MTLFTSTISIPALAVGIAIGCAALTAFQPPAGIGGQAPPPAGAGQVPPPTGGRGGGRAGGPGGPQRPPIDPAVLERGKGLYSVHCASCHGSEARGGESGPNLLRSPIILEDKAGELLLPIVKAGRPERGMPARPDLTDSQITDIAALLRNLRTTGRDPGRNRPATIVVGTASEGQAYFTATCAKCHSVTGDLKGLAAKYPEPRQLQQAWLSGTAAGGRGGPVIAAPKTSITVTLPSGEVVKGEQGRLDDFIVSLKLPDGSVRTFQRNGDVPKLEIHDPLEPHRRLVPTYRDRDIHNLTAYLVTLK